MKSLLLLTFCILIVLCHSQYNGGTVNMNLILTTSTFVQMCLEFPENPSFVTNSITLRPYQWSDDLTNVNRYDYVMSRNYSVNWPTSFNPDYCFETKRGTPIQDENVHFIYTPSSVIINQGQNNELIMNLFLQSLNVGLYTYNPNNPPIINDPVLGDDNSQDGQANTDFIGGAVRFDANEMACEYGNFFREGVPSGYQNDYVSARKANGAGMWAHTNPSSCGRCMLVKGAKSNRWVELMVTDACPEDGVCAKRNWIDMSPDAMNALDHYSDGVHQQTHRWAPCTRITGTIELRLEPGSYNGAGWFNIRNFRYPLVNVAIGCGNGVITNWTPLSRYNVDVTNLWRYDFSCGSSLQFKFTGFNEETRVNVELVTPMQDSTLTLDQWISGDGKRRKKRRNYRATALNFPSYSTPPVESSCFCNEFPCSCTPGPAPSPSPSQVCVINGRCEGDETCQNCPEDCVTTSTTCGNNICESPYENCQNCPQDCNSVTKGSPSNRHCCGGQEGCNDSRCSANGKTCNTVAIACCGDGTCDETAGETITQCPNDCNNCGDGICDTGETCANCPNDCTCDPGFVCNQECTKCGNGVCDLGEETCENCRSDCACTGQNEECVENQCIVPVCGDGTCEGSETLSTCCQDCKGITGECCTNDDCTSGYECNTNNECVSPTAASIYDHSTAPQYTIPGDCDGNPITVAVELQVDANIVVQQIVWWAPTTTQWTISVWNVNNPTIPLTQVNNVNVGSQDWARYTIDLGISAPATIIVGVRPNDNCWPYGGASNFPVEIISNSLSAVAGRYIYSGDKNQMPNQRDVNSQYYVDVNAIVGPVSYTCGDNTCETADGESIANCCQDCQGTAECCTNADCNGLDETCENNICVTPIPTPAPTPVPCTTCKGKNRARGCCCNFGANKPGCGNGLTCEVCNECSNGGGVCCDNGICDSIGSSIAITSVGSSSVASTSIIVLSIVSVLIVVGIFIKRKVSKTTNNNEEQECNEQIEMEA